MKTIDLYQKLVHLVLGGNGDLPIYVRDVEGELKEMEDVIVDKAYFEPALVISVKEVY